MTFPESIRASGFSALIRGSASEAWIFRYSSSRRRLDGLEMMARSMGLPKRAFAQLLGDDPVAGRIQPAKILSDLAPVGQFIVRSDRKTEDLGGGWDRRVARSVKALRRRSR